MIAALLFGQACSQGVQFFQPYVPGSPSRGALVSQNAPVPMVPLTADEMSYQFVMLGQDEPVQEEGAPYLTVAGVAVQLSRSERAPRRRIASPLMQMQQATAGTALGAGTVAPSSRGAPAGVDSAILVQGGSLRTWSYRSPAVEQVQVVLGTEGRPLDADIELWHGPDNTPVKMR